MAREITMPKLSDTMEEGKVLRWLKTEGDRVERGEIIAEVETDKADMEMEAFESGVLLAITVGPGETAAVGDVIGWVGKAGEKVEARGARGADGPRRKPSRSEAVGPDGGDLAKEADEEVRAGRPRKTDLAKEMDEVGEKAKGRRRSATEAATVTEARPPVVETPARPTERRGVGNGDGARRPPAPERRGTAGGAAGRSEAEPVDEGLEPGPHADIADVIEPDVEAEAEGEEGSATQAPSGLPRRRPRPGKGLHDHLPFRSPRERGGGRTKISPLARRLARDAGLDTSGLRGSGPDGRIVRADVERAIHEAAGRPVAGAEAAGRPDEPATVPAPREARPERPAPPVPLAAGELGTELPHSRMRRAMASRLTEAKRTVPHFYTTVAVRMERALELKEALGDRHPGAKVSVTHLILKAAALAVQRYPRVNGVFEEDRIRIPRTVDVGLAVAVEDGLIVPVIRDCAGRPLLEIARDAGAAVARARAGKLAQDDLQGATFSISSLGMFGIEAFAAILTPPQSGMLAVGGTAEEPVVQDGQVVPGNVCRLTLSADHRVIDGVLAAAFLVETKRLLEAPLALVV